MQASQCSERSERNFYLHLAYFASNRIGVVHFTNSCDITNPVALAYGCCGNFHYGLLSNHDYRLGDQLPAVAVDACGASVIGRRVIAPAVGWIGVLVDPVDAV